MAYETIQQIIMDNPKSFTDLGTHKMLVYPTVYPISGGGLFITARRYSTNEYRYTVEIADSSGVRPQSAFMQFRTIDEAEIYAEYYQAIRSVRV